MHVRYTYVLSSNRKWTCQNTYSRYDTALRQCASQPVLSFVYSFRSFVASLLYPSHCVAAGGNDRSKTTQTYPCCCAGCAIDVCLLHHHHPPMYRTALSTVLYYTRYELCSCGTHFRTPFNLGLYDEVLHPPSDYHLVLVDRNGIVVVIVVVVVVVIVVKVKVDGFLRGKRHNRRSQSGPTGTTAKVHAIKGWVRTIQQRSGTHQ
mmetsp:Transcript_15188/g.31409  ORF Transcript_15188/g.31409 Transcript_15188/m.31409 type:complete len:205 (-) Transcript_15188:1004-1618(-)